MFQKFFRISVYREFAHDGTRSQRNGSKLLGISFVWLGFSPVTDVPVYGKTGIWSLFYANYRAYFLLEFLLAICLHFLVVVSFFFRATGWKRFPFRNSPRWPLFRSSTFPNINFNLTKNWIISLGWSNQPFCQLLRMPTSSFRFMAGAFESAARLLGSLIRCSLVFS